MHYTRAYVDRASTEGDGLLRFVAATEGVKGDGIDLKMSGARLERYRANPIFGYGHRYYSREDLPIGRAPEVDLVGQSLKIGVEFDQEDPFAVRVEKKYRGHFLNAVSIGFNVLEWEDDRGSYWQGGTATDWELLEVSAVPVPMDASAVVTGGRSLRDLFGDLPLDPSVQVERDTVTLTRSVRVSEDLIRAADPLQLAVHLARHLTEAPTAPAGPAPEVTETRTAEEPVTDTDQPDDPAPVDVLGALRQVVDEAVEAAFAKRTIVGDHITPPAQNTPETDIEPASDEPPAPQSGVDHDAARSLLAAFETNQEDAQ